MQSTGNQAQARPTCDDNDCGHDEDIESLWGIYGQEDAVSEARNMSPVEA